MFFLASGFASAAELSEFEKRLIDRNIEWSQTIDSFAENLDVFLAGRKVTKRKNDTSVVLSSSTYHSEGQDVKNSTHLNVNLRLPNVEEHWQLRFTSYDENEEDRGVNRTYFRRTPREENYGASLGFFQRFGKLSTTFRPRLKLTDPLQLSYILRLETQGGEGDLQFKPRVEFFADPEKGTGVFGALNVDYYFSAKYTGTLINESEYRDFRNSFFSTNGLSLTQILDRKSLFNYSLMFFTQSRPAPHLTNFSVTTGYSRVLYRKVLEASIVPYLDFAKLNGFKGHAGIAVNVALIF